LENETETPSVVFVILTRPASNQVSSIHGRMPVIAPESLWDKWLDFPERVDGEMDDMANKEIFSHVVRKSVEEVSFEAACPDDSIRAPTKTRDLF
jgi:putative SOS response-associated peptidase YedK